MKYAHTQILHNYLSIYIKFKKKRWANPFKDHTVDQQLPETYYLTALSIHLGQGLCLFMCRPTY